MAGKLATFLALMATASAIATSCEEGGCKVPQDELSLIQTRLEPNQKEGYNFKKNKDPRCCSGGTVAPRGNCCCGGQCDVCSASSGICNNREETSGLDEAAATQEIKEDAAAATEGYEKFQNATTLGLPFSSSCPSHFDASDASNAAIFKFADDCLESVQVSKLSETELGKLAACSGRNAVDIVAYQDKGMAAKTKNQLQNGGICNAKVYKVKCSGGKVSAKCMQRKLYRGYTKNSARCHDSTGFDCAKNWGGFWAAVNPKAAGISKATYRERYAVCEGWNADLDGIWEANIGERTGCGTYILIGNGESVKGCPRPITKGKETYDYSPYLQVVTCKYPPSDLMSGGTDISASGWN